MKHKTKTAGFTLIEIVVGIGIFTAIAMALTLFSRNVWFYGSFIATGLADANDGRIALKHIVAEIRTAKSADNGAYVISLANATAITFYSDIDDDGLTEKVRYFLNGTTLQKGVVKPTGSPLAYTGIEQISTVVANVRNTNIFSFYDEDYDGTTAALPTPVTIALVRLVKIYLTIDRDVNRAPAATMISTQVSLRNLKDNL